MPVTDAIEDAFIPTVSIASFGETGNAPLERRIVLRVFGSPPIRLNKELFYLSGSLPEGDIIQNSMKISRRV